ncbi:MAG TPA: CHAT domain-containing tetratricopeptide repeat protein, partial [Hyphomicrobiaceae bacterium]|nr:CHAT domain-containing tetratricopeptide repeat protein [Hyphomicrobiaceae bacterium]
RSLNNLAYLYQVQGRLREAEPLHKRALGIWEKALPPGHPDLAWSLNNLGILYNVQDRLSDAEPMYKRALEIRENALPDGHPDIARSLANLASVYQKQRRLAEAESLYQRAQKIFEKALPAGHPDIATCLNNLAVVYDAQGRYMEAEFLYKRALDMREKELPAGHPDIAANLNNLGILYQAQGRLADAERLMQRALELREKALPPTHPEIAASLGNLAALNMTQKKWAAAYDLFLRDTEIRISGLRRANEPLAESAGLSSGSAAQDAKQGAGAFHGLIKAAHRFAASETDRSPELVGATFTRAQWATASEAATSLAQMAARGARGDAQLARLVRERQDLVGEWQTRDKELVAASTLPRERRNAAADQTLRNRLAAINLRLAGIDRTLARDFPDYAALANPDPLPIAEVRGLLRQDEALVLMLDTRPLAGTPEEAFLWVVTRAAARWVRLDPGTKALTDRVATLRCGLDQSAWDGEGDIRCARLLGGDYRAEQVSVDKTLPFDLARAHELYQALFGQIEDLIEGKHLLIVPSGPLTAIPFQVLITDKPSVAIPAKAAGYSDAAWLTKRHAITVLPSVASLKALRQLAKDGHADRAMIGFGNPLLDGPDARYGKWAISARARRSCPTTPGQLVEAPTSDRRGLIPFKLSSSLADVTEIRMQVPLPETADELCAVARDLQVSNDHIRLGTNATETEVKHLSAIGELSKYRIVYFATHGALAGQISGNSEPGLLLTPPVVATEADDGYLSASEIAELKLDADWVILSACNTAAGGAEGAEALSGLARAFFYAGARALLVSHWAVDSQATVSLVTKAFDALKGEPDIGRAQALRRSMLALISSRGRNAHPANWAPFVVVGEGAR